MTSETASEDLLARNARIQTYMRIFDKRKSPKSIVEIGSWKGDFSNLLNIAFPESNLFLVDPWLCSLKNSVGWYGVNTIDQGGMDEIYNRVVERFRDKSLVTISRGNVEAFYSRNQDFSADFVYIDGDHTYEGCLFDAMYSHKFTALGSVLAFDDYVLGGWWGDGVIKAVSSFLGTYSSHYKLMGIYSNQCVIERIA